jgi:hypothetical protein
VRERNRGAPTGSPLATLTGGVSCEAVHLGDMVVKRPKKLLAVPGHRPAASGHIFRPPGLGTAVH